MNLHLDATLSCTSAAGDAHVRGPPSPTLLWGRDALATAAPKRRNSSSARSRSSSSNMTTSVVLQDVGDREGSAGLAGVLDRWNKREHPELSIPIDFVG